MLSHDDSAIENIDINDTGISISTSGIMDGGDTTDISMTESISFDTCSFNEEIHSLTSGASSKEVSPYHKSLTLPSKLDVKNVEWDELDDLLQVERKIDENDKLYQTMPSPLPSRSSAEQDESQSQLPLLSSPPQNNSEATDDSPKSETETDFKSALISISSTTETVDDSTLTGNTNDEYLTPMNTLRPVDFDDFKKQIRNEYIQNASQLQHSNDGTLKSHQPIDPSRINDSLKLYSENMMSKSYCGEAALREVPSAVPYQTLKDDRSESSPVRRNYVVKKSCSAAISSTSDDTSSYADSVSIIRSKSGPNWYRDNSNNGHYDIDSDEDTPTLKPSTIKKRSIHIKMDCYDELSNGVSSTSGTSSTLTTPTSPNNDEYLYYSPPGDDDNDNDDDVGVVVLRKPKSGSTAIKRRSGNKRYKHKNSIAIFATIISPFSLH